MSLQGLTDLIRQSKEFIAAEKWSVKASPIFSPGFPVGSVPLLSAIHDPGRVMLVVTPPTLDQAEN